MTTATRTKVLKEEAETLKREVTILKREIEALKTQNLGLRGRIAHQSETIGRQRKALSYLNRQSEIMEDEIRLFLPTDFGAAVPGSSEDITYAITEGGFETKEGWETEMRKRVLSQAGTLAANLSVADVMAVHVQPGRWIGPGKLEVHLRAWLPKGEEEGNAEDAAMEEEMESSSPCPRAMPRSR